MILPRSAIFHLQVNFHLYFPASWWYEVEIDDLKMKASFFAPSFGKQKSPLFHFVLKKVLS